MRLWANVYDASDTLLGEGPITSIQDVQVTRVLDGVGRVSMRLPGTDARALDLLQNERRVKVYLLEGDDSSADFTQREIAFFIVRSREAGMQASGWTLTVSGPDILDELKRTSVALGLTYNNETNGGFGNWPTVAILSDLVGKVQGALWALQSVAFPSGSEHYARFEGVNILKAIHSVLQDKGLHFRYGSSLGSVRFLQAGAFGQSSGVTLLQAVEYTPEVSAQTHVGLVESLRLTSQSEDVVNKVIVLGAGESDSRLTLEKSTRSLAGGDPYDVQSETRNDRTVWYLADAASISQYGTLEKVTVFDQIQVASNNTADILTASNALYDVAANYLLRHKDPLLSYAVEVTNLKTSVKAGDKVRLIYKGFIEKENPDGSISLLPPENIHADFWVMEVTETVSASGTKQRFTLNNIDRVQLDAAKILVGELEKIQVAGLVLKPYASHYNFPYKKEIDATHSAIIPLYFTSRTLRVRQVLLRLQTSPFRATATGAASGGGSTQTSQSVGHTHTIMRLDSTPPAGTGSVKKFTIFDGSSTFWFEANTSASAPKAFEPTTAGAHTHDVTIPAHTHAMQYGIYDDTTRPANVTVTINGVDVTAALGGPWGTTGSNLDVTLDITPYIENAVGGFQKLHSIVIGCASGRGLIQGILEVYEDIQSLG